MVLDAWQKAFGTLLSLFNKKLSMVSQGRHSMIMFTAWPLPPFPVSLPATSLPGPWVAATGTTQGDPPRGSVGAPGRDLCWECPYYFFLPESFCGPLIPCHLSEVSSASSYSTVSWYFCINTGQKSAEKLPFTLNFLFQLPKMGFPI